MFIIQIVNACMELWFISTTSSSKGNLYGLLPLFNRPARCIGNFTKCQILKIHRFLKYRFYLNNKWYLQAFQSFSSMSKYFKFSSDFSQFSSDFSQFLHKIFTIFFSKSVRRNLDFLCQIYFHINNICGFYFIKQFYWINSKKTDQFIRF